MADMLHQIQINVPPAKVYEALTTQTGLQSWWTGDCVAQPEVGSIAEFGFNHHATVFRMRVGELAANQRVVWECLGNVEEWLGTRLTWELQPQESATILCFKHGNWRSTEGWFAMCYSTWGALMHRLKDYAEGKNPGPQFAG